MQRRPPTCEDIDPLFPGQPWMQLSSYNASQLGRGLRDVAGKVDEARLWHPDIEIEKGKIGLKSQQI